MNENSLLSYDIIGKEVVRLLGHKQTDADRMLSLDEFSERHLIPLIRRGGNWLDLLEIGVTSAMRNGVKFDYVDQDVPGLTGDELALVGKIASAISALKRMRRVLPE